MHFIINLYNILIDNKWEAEFKGSPDEPKSFFKG